MAANMKAEARSIFNQALALADVRRAEMRNFQAREKIITDAGRTFDATQSSTLLTIAIGKAATPMYETVAELLQTSAWPARTHSAVVVSPHKPSVQHGALKYFVGAHPTPDETSREAAKTILAELHRADSETLVLFLISGGSSSMVELPMDPSITVLDIAAFNRCLVGSDLSIAEINVLRKHLSAVKGGRMAEAAAPAAQCTLIVSDVPASFLDVVGSGPSLPDSSSTEMCHEVFERLRRMRTLPAPVEKVFERGPSETPKRDHPAFVNAAYACILSSDDLATAALHTANSLGFYAEIDNTCDEWSSGDASGYLLDRSAQLSKRHGKTCLISVGEVRVNVLDPTGVGGRNQHFALQCARRLQHQERDVTVLSAGSDGIDGNSPAAGAIATQATWSRAEGLGFDPARTLEQFDSFRLFHSLGDTIVLGPTGNNLRDLRLILT